MDRRETVIAALRHIETAKLPYHIDFTQQESDRVAEYTGDPDFIGKAGAYLHYHQYWGWPTEIPGKKEHFLDEYGVTWNRSGEDKDIGVIDHPIIDEPDISLWKEPDLDEKRLRREWETLLAGREDRFTFPGIGFSLFERAWSLCGMENVFAYMLQEEEFLDELLDKICAYNLKIIRMSLEYPFDGFYFGDDWGQQRGLMMGPALWRRFIKPRLARMYAEVKNAGRFVMQHSCGDIEEVFPDLIDMGLDCYQTFQPEIYDIEKVKRTYGGSLSFWGGISTQQLLPFASPDKVYSETRRIMDIMRKSGGYIAAPTHAVPHDVPAENVMAMLKAFKEDIK
ncbi:MAG: uroporphyrinogen decarboxylase family protein [Saccharofermentanales bacterium]